MTGIDNPAALSALAKGDAENFLVAATPGGIEAQEAAGQKELVASTKIPVEMNPSREAFEAVGFVFGDQAGDLFLHATLPPGWTRNATEHAMWSDILDEKGRRRVSVFYKAAFYDRVARAFLESRFKYGHKYENNEPIAVTVTDCGATLRSWKIPDASDRYEARRRVGQLAGSWLDSEYPRWRDPTAYWND